MPERRHKPVLFDLDTKDYRGDIGLAIGWDSGILAWIQKDKYKCTRTALYST